MMPWCGFNPKMLVGLDDLMVGLLDQAKDRMVRQHRTMEEVFAIETLEMTLFASALQKHFPDVNPVGESGQATALLKKLNAYDAGT